MFKEGDLQERHVESLRSLPKCLVFAPRSTPAAWLFGQSRSGSATGDSGKADAATTPVPHKSYHRTERCGLQHVLSSLAIIGVLLALACSSAAAGQEAAAWYFGDSVLVQFGAGGAVSVGISNFSTSEGSAVWCNPATGVPLVYTDGQTVWNGAGNVMSNGTGLMGHESSTQSALLIPQPGDANRLVLFTAGVGPYVIPDNNGIRYSLVDIALNTVIVKNTPLLEPATEKLVGIPHCNGHDYWAVGHEWGTDAFYAWLVTASGVSSRPVVSSTGTVVPETAGVYTIGFLKASPDGRRIVSTGYYPDAVQLFDFNSSLGVVSGPITLPVNGSVYGASFSPDNSKLYIADQQLGTQSLIRIYQYTLSGTPAEILSSRTPVFQFVGGVGDEIGALQLAPDGKIYCAREGGQWLGVINNPNASGTACNYVHDGLYLGGRRSLLGLPNFIDAGFNTGAGCFPPAAGFQLDTTICAGMCISVEDKSLNQPASWRWEFPGGTPAVFVGQHPGNICYYTPGTYSVRLIAANSVGSDTLERRDAVTVLPRLGASAGADAALCPGSSVLLTGSGGAVYRWEPAAGLDHPDSAVTLAHPTSTTTYILTVQEGLCTDRDTVTLTVHPQPTIVAGSYSLCGGGSVLHNAAGSAGVYRWAPAEGVSNPDTSAPILSPEITTDYTVTLTDLHGCSTSAVVRVEVNESGIDAGRDTSVCRGSGVQLRATGLSGVYRWTPASGLDDPTSAIPTAFPLATTMYVVTVTGGNCTATDSVLVVVRDLPQVHAGGDVAICRNGEVLLHATGSAGSYSWEPSAGVEHPDAASTLVRPSTTTTYRVTVTDEYGCASSDEVIVVVDTSLAIDAGGDVQLCAGDSVQLDAYIGEGSYTWTPAEGLDNPASPRPIVSPRVTTVYRLAVSMAEGCSGTDSVTIAVLPLPLVDAGQSVVICRGDTAQLQVQTNGELLGWEPASSIDNALSATPRAFPTETVWYIATVRSANGCIARDSVLVEVRTPGKVIVESDTTICAGAEITLHATGQGPFSWEPAALVDAPHAAVVRARPAQRTVFTVLSQQDGCSLYDSVVVSISEPVRLLLVLPKVVCTPGASVRLPIFVRSTTPFPTLATATIELAVMYDRRVLDVSDITIGRIISREKIGDYGVLTLRVDDISTDSLSIGTELTSLLGTALLAAADTTELVAPSVAVDIPGYCTAVEARRGGVRLEGYCLGSDLRMFERPRITLAPNPVADVLTVAARAMNGQKLVFSVESLWGITLLRYAEVVPASGAIELDVSSLPAGVYYLVVGSGVQRITVPLCIVR